MGILSGNPQLEPMHYGEVFGVWSYLKTAKDALSGYQTLINHNGDDDLDDFLRDLAHDTKDEIKKVEELLRINGIALPPSPPEKPVANLENIPPGARFTDPEIAAAVSADLAAGMVACSQQIGQSIREDIGMMFVQFHATKVKFAARILRINKEKGWLIPPPLHLGTPELQTV